MVCGEYREHVGKARAAGADFEYCVVELSDVGADARGAGAGAGGERNDFEDADGRRAVRADAGACGGEEVRAAGVAGERVGRAVERSAGAERICGLPGVCGRENERRGDRVFAVRRKQAVHAGDGGSEYVRRVAVFELGGAGAAVEERIRLREAAVHGVRALCGATGVVSPISGDVSPRAAGIAVWEPGDGGKGDRPFAETGFRAADQQQESGRAAGAVRGGAGEGSDQLV